MFRTPVGMNGNLATDVELDQTRAGVDRAKFRVATTERQRDENGNWRDSEAVFHSVVAYGATARAAARTFAKGDRVAIVGESTTEAWTDREGNRRQSTQVKADAIGADPIFTEVNIDRGPGRGPSAEFSVDRSAAVSPGPQQEFEAQPAAAPTDPQIAQQGYQQQSPGFER